MQKYMITKMKTELLQRRLEKLFDEIKEIAQKKVYIFADDNDRLKYIVDLIEDYENETPA